MLTLLKRIRRFILNVIAVYTPWGNFHNDENKLLKKYYSINNKQLKVKNTCIIIMIDGRFIHGGLTDRIRGITTIYGYCKEKNIPFYINHCYPFLLQDYLTVNSYNWIIAPENISYNIKEAVPVCLNSFALPNEFHRIFMNYMIKKYRRKQIHLYTSTRFLDSDFSKNFKELFKPTIKLEHAINETSKLIGNKYIAIVFRFQQLLGDFKEPGYITLSQEEQIKLIEKCINKVVELYKEENNNVVILVTSDSYKFLEAISKQLDFVRIIPGRIVHMDHTKGATFETYMKSFIDLFMLSKADKIYLFQTGNMYHSGFAQRAAMINNKQYQEIVF